MVDLGGGEPQAVGSTKPFSASAAWGTKRSIPPGFRKKALLITAALWSLQYLLMTARALLFEINSADLMLKRTAWCAAGMVITGLIYLLLERLWNTKFIYQALVTLAAAIPAGLLVSMINALIYHGTIGDVEWIPGHVDMGSYWLWFYFGWTSIVLALSYSMRAEQEQRARVDAQIFAHHAQLRALRYQLNPHFLFNTLNSIAALSLDGKAQVAEKMLVRLSAFLRSGLATDPLEEVRLGDEIEQQKLYFDIERLRFPDRLVVEIHIPEPLLDAMVPSFILQPLVENAIKHGVSPSRSVTTVSVSARAEGDMLKLSVEDDSDATPQGDGTGVGLTNVETRLAAQYGNRFGFSAGKRQPGGFFAEMRFPLRYVS